MSPPVDPITVSVIQHRLRAIVEEMGEAMLRTSYSQILNSSRDFSTALCDPEGRLIAQAEHVPIHVGALPLAAKSVHEFFKGTIRPGDVYLLNDPYRGGNHLPDLTAFVPVFDGDRLAFWSINRSHQSDIGGATHGAYNAGATEIWQEGLRIPPLQLYDRGKRREDVYEMIVLNVRHPRDFRGDLAAMIGSARVGERRLQAAAGRVRLGRRRMPRSRRCSTAPSGRCAPIIAGWQDGVYDGEAMLDDDGHGFKDIHIRATVTKRGSDLEVDLTDSHPQVTGFINSSYANTHSAVVVALAYLIDPDTPKNDGAFRPLKLISSSEGTIVWPRPGAPVTLCTNHCGQEIIEAIIKRAGAGLPGARHGGLGPPLPHRHPGHRPAHGKPFIWHLFQARPGGGASSAGDGWPGAGEWQAAGGIKFGSLEVHEVRFPAVLPPPRVPARQRRRRALSRRPGRRARARRSRRPSRPSATRRATASSTAPAACSAAQDGEPHRYCAAARPAAPDRPLKTKETGIVLRPGRRARTRSRAAAAAGAIRSSARPRSARATSTLGFVSAKGTLSHATGSASTSAARSRILSPSTTQGRVTHRQGGLDARRPVARRHGGPRPAGGDARYSTARPCWRAPSASSMARPSRPTRCSSARAPRSAC